MASRDAGRSSPSRASQGAADGFGRLCGAWGEGTAQLGLRGPRGLAKGRAGPAPGPRRQHTGELLDLSGAMLWFQGAIPAAIASAKRSGAVFVVFVAGERNGGPRYGGDTPSGLPPTSGGPSRSFVY